MRKLLTDWWPDWQDAGVRGTFYREDGTFLVGTIYADDVITGGEDEVPIFNVHGDDDQVESLTDFDAVEFATAEH